MAVNVWIELTLHDQIRDCADARNFAVRYMKYQQAHPDFVAAERPNKADAFKADAFVR